MYMYMFICTCGLHWQCVCMYVCMCVCVCVCVCVHVCVHTCTRVHKSRFSPYDAPVIVWSPCHCLMVCHETILVWMITGITGCSDDDENALLHDLDFVDSRTAWLA